jgi:hypothetical protein
MPAAARRPPAPRFLPYLPNVGTVNGRLELVRQWQRTYDEEMAANPWKPGMLPSMDRYALDGGVSTAAWQRRCLEAHWSAQTLGAILVGIRWTRELEREEAALYAPGMPSALHEARWCNAFAWALWCATGSRAPCSLEELAAEVQP